MRERESCLFRLVPILNLRLNNDLLFGLDYAYRGSPSIRSNSAVNRTVFRQRRRGEKFDCLTGDGPTRGILRRIPKFSRRKRPSVFSTAHFYQAQRPGANMRYGRVITQTRGAREAAGSLV